MGSFENEKSVPGKVPGKHNSRAHQCPDIRRDVRGNLSRKESKHRERDRHVYHQTRARNDEEQKRLPYTDRRIMLKDPPFIQQVTVGDRHEKGDAFEEYEQFAAHSRAEEVHEDIKHGKVKCRIQHPDTDEFKKDIHIGSFFACNNRTEHCSEEQCSAKYLY
jgi:hypothetical protein